MARLVPAKPKNVHQKELSLLLSMEKGFDDAHVVFQNKPIDGYIIAHPDTGTVLVAVGTGKQSYDADAETFSGYDADELSTLASAAVRKKVSTVVYLSETDRPHGFDDKRYLFAKDEMGFATAVVNAVRESEPLGEEGISGLIELVSPGAQAYVKGEITPAQKEWRSMQAEASKQARTAATASKLSKPEGSADPSGMKSHADSGPASTGTGDAGANEMQVEGRKLNEDIAALSKSHPLVSLIRQGVETVSARGDLVIQGLKVTPEDVADPSFLLPALLVSSAEDWAAVVASKKGQGGFHVRLKTDKNALLGYKVVGLDPATPFLLMIPVIQKMKLARKLRTSLSGDGSNQETYVFDEVAEQFRRWLAKNRFDTDAIDDITIRVVTSV